MESKDTGGIRLLETSTIAHDKWLQLRSRRFIDRHGETHSWSYVERTAKRSAVVIIARDQQAKSLVLIRQFRIPLAAWIYEFPAGLVDEGESPEQAAIRELQEETGYEGEVIGISPALPTSSGLSSEFIYLVEIACRQGPGSSAHEGAEAIELVLVPDTPAGMQSFLDEARSNKAIIDAKLYSWLHGRLAQHGQLL